MLQTEGKLKQTNLVVVLTGLMEAGKTTLLHRLFGKDLPDRYNSTGIAERSLRGLTQYLCSADNNNRFCLFSAHYITKNVVISKQIWYIIAITYNPQNFLLITASLSVRRKTVVQFAYKKK